MHARSNWRINNACFRNGHWTISMLNCLTFFAISWQATLPSAQKGNTVNVDELLVLITYT